MHDLEESRVLHLVYYLVTHLGYSAPLGTSCTDGAGDREDPAEIHVRGGNGSEAGHVAGLVLKTREMAFRCALQQLDGELAGGHA